MMNGYFKPPSAVTALKQVNDPVYKICLLYFFFHLLETCVHGIELRFRFQLDVGDGMRLADWLFRVYWPFKTVFHVRFPFEFNVLDGMWLASCMFPV